MYKARFKEWGWRKYRDGRVMIAAQCLARNRQNRPTAFRFRGQVFSDSDVTAYFQRHMEYTYTQAPPSPTGSILADIEAFTPIPLEDLALLSELEDPQLQTPIVEAIPMMVDGGDSITERDAIVASIIFPDAETQYQPTIVMTSTISRPADDSDQEESPQSTSLILAPATSPPAHRTNEYRWVAQASQPCLPLRNPADLWMHEKLLRAFRDFHVGSFEAGRWYSVGPLERCVSRTNGWKCSEALDQNLACCKDSVRRGRDRHAIAFMNKACTYLLGTLREDNLDSLGHIIRTMISLLQHGSTHLQEEFVRFLGNCFTHDDHPLREASSIMLRYCRERILFQRLLEIHQAILEGYLSPKHTEALHARYAKLYSTPNTSLSAWKTLLDDLASSLGPNHWLYLRVCNKIGKRLCDSGDFAAVLELYSRFTLSEILRDPERVKLYDACRALILLARAEFALCGDETAIRTLTKCENIVWPSSMMLSYKIMLMDACRRVLLDYGRLGEARRFQVRVGELKDLEEKTVQQEFEKMAQGIID